MSLLTRTNLLAQFGFNPAFSGLMIPSVSGDSERMVSPSLDDDALALAGLNRQVRREAARDGASPHVRIHNNVKTLLGAPHGRNSVECLFQYLGDDGYIDRSIDLETERDLAAHRYTSQTVVTRWSPEGPRHGASSVSKSMLSKQLRPGSYRYPEYWRDHWLRISLAGDLLNRISYGDPDFLGLPRKHTLAELAVAFSAFVYMTESFADPLMLGDGLYVVDVRGDTHRILHPGSDDFGEIHEELAPFLQGEKIRVVSTPPDPDEPVTYENTPALDMSFAATDVLGLHEEKTVIVQVTCPPERRRLSLQNGLLMIAERVMAG